MSLAGRADWALMIAVHDVLRRDLDQPPGELGGIAAAIRGGHTNRRAGITLPWALARASPDIREHVQSQRPAPARLLCRTVWLPRYARTTPAL
jgi:hypothetical protein